MDHILANRRIWLFGTIALLAVLAFGVSLQLSKPTRPTATPSGQQQKELEIDMIHQQTEPMGWVFGRVVGFEGADKPLLPRQSFPAPLIGSPPKSASR